MLSHFENEPEDHARLIHPTHPVNPPIIVEEHPSVIIEEPALIIEEPALIIEEPAVVVAPPV